jgi:hypothetical protein
MVRPFTTSLIAAASLLALVGSAGAHTRAAVISAPPPPAQTTAVVSAAAVPATAPVAAPLPLLVMAAAVVAAGTSRRRLALALMLVTAVIGVDAAIHSVHHLNDSDAAAACVLASSVAHSPAVLADDTALVVMLAPAPESQPTAGDGGAAFEAARPDRGRAPPSSSAA